MYQLIVKPKAEKKCQRFTQNDLEKVGKAFVELAKNPYSEKLQIKKLFFTKGKFYRVRLGNLRMIYEIDDSAKKVLVHLVDFRGSVY